MKHDFPSVRIVETKLVFEDGKYCKLPSEYSRHNNFERISIFYKQLISEVGESLVIGEDILGFTYFKIGFICYIGIICTAGNRGKFNVLKKKYPNNKFSKDYIQKRLETEVKFLKQQEYIPIEVVTHNLHELRGLNAKVTENIDALMKLDDEESWDEQFENADGNLKKIYVASRLTKFILDNTKFYNSQFLETLMLKKDRYFNPHRCVSKIVKIYRNDFQKEKYDIEFNGSSHVKLQGEKEYFEILIKIFVENALKYSVEKKIGPKVRIIQRDSILNIEIHSYGRIIPFDERRNIFLKGYRSSINKNQIEGTGVGLYNAKKLVEKFGGEIEV